MFWYLRSQRSKQTNLADLHFFWNMHSFQTTSAKNCWKRTLNMKVYYITTLNYQLTGHPEKFKIKLYYFEERLILQCKSWSYCNRFIYVSSVVTNFQNDLFFLKSISKFEDSLFYFLYHWSWFVIKTCFTTYLEKCFLNSNLYSWSRQPIFFHNVIINQWGQLLPGSIKDFFWRSIVTP